MQNTAGDIALSFNDAEMYTAVRDAGIRTGTSVFLIVNMVEC
jgi:hypothetical protein